MGGFEAGGLLKYDRGHFARLVGPLLATAE
jgi:hypothetical protein